MAANPLLCETCRFWNRSDDYNPEDRYSTRMCLLLGDDGRKDSYKAWVIPWQGAQEGSLATRHNFGCVEHQERDAR